MCIVYVLCIILLRAIRNKCIQDMWAAIIDLFVFQNENT